jgi:hypothetical protein
MPQRKKSNKKPAHTGIVRTARGTFAPGTSGNIHGKPPGVFSIVSIIKRQLQDVPDGQKKNYAEALVKKVMHQAIIDGDHNSQKMLIQYVDGMPQTNIDLTSGGEPLENPFEDAQLDRVAKRIVEGARKAHGVSKSKGESD